MIKDFFLVLSFSALFLVACKQKKGINKSEYTLEKKIIGKWGGKNESSPVWLFSEDSIYYYQFQKSFKYQIINQNLLIEFNGNITVLKDVSINEDTLYFKDEANLKIEAYRHP
jgi:hypothetical protein